MATGKKIAFLDRDGTLIIEPADEQVDRLDKVALVPGVIPALSRLRDAGFEFVMVTNQDESVAHADQIAECDDDSRHESHFVQGIHLAIGWLCDQGPVAIDEKHLQHVTRTSVGQPVHARRVPRASRG